MSAYDDLSDRARWFLENFDELGLAEICADRERAGMVTLPKKAFDQLVKVTTHVSLSRSAALTQGAYPDAAARRALGALDDAGLLDKKQPEQEGQGATTRRRSTAMSPAEELRAAAARLRALLADPELTAGPWLSLDHGDRLLRNQPGDEDQAPVYVINEPMSNGANAAFIAAMHPGIGAALADMLEAISYTPDDGSLEDPDSDRHDGCDTTVCAPAAALVVARLINQEPS